jgi:prepilin-type N-terminal cleavage/methylation domain-containing protein
MTLEKNITFHKNGFTLIELLLGVTLSAILMMGIIVFVSSSLGSTMSTKNMLEEGNKNEHFEQKLTETLGNIMGSGVYMTGTNFGGGYFTGIFLATGNQNLPITFLGLRTQTGHCDSYSGTASETGTVFRLALRQFVIPAIQNPTSYTLSLTGNTVFSGVNRIIGTGYPGNALTDSGIDTELSSPSALVQKGTRLYIADTMNDRILSYDTISKGISKLLSREDGISKPTSLYFSGNTLMIASSGNGKIFSLQDGDTGGGSKFSATFQVNNNFSANNFQFTFSSIPLITSLVNKDEFTFSGPGIGAANNANDFVNTGASLQYTFS